MGWASPPQGLVKSSVGLDLIPTMPREKTSWLGVLVVVLHLQFHLKLQRGRFKDSYLGWGDSLGNQASTSLISCSVVYQQKSCWRPAEACYTAVLSDRCVQRRGWTEATEGVDGGWGRWTRRHETSLHKNAKEASIHLHLSLLILALTFQHWQVKSSVTVWRDAMRGRLLNGALTAFDRYHVFALSHQTQSRGRYNLLPRARHAMPLWPDWACVHKQTSEVTRNPKCHPQSWTMTNNTSPGGARK